MKQQKKETKPQNRKERADERAVMSKHMRPARDDKFVSRSGVVIRF